MRKFSTSVKLILFSLAFLYLPSVVYAQHDGTEDLFELVLDNILDIKITSASRSSRSVRDLPVSIYVITREQIEQKNYLSLVELLKDVPTIKTSQPGNAIDGETFLMRGLLGNSYTKILIDGLPITPSVVSGMPLGEQISISSIERVEVLFGPAAALYGADALAGVINIVTRRSEKNTFEAYIGGGELGYKSANMHAELVKKEYHALFYANYGAKSDLKNFDGYQDVYNASTYFNRYGGDSTYTKNAFPNFNLGLGCKLSYKQLSLSYDFFRRNEHSSLGQHPAWYRYDNPETIWGEDIHRLALRYTQPIGNKLTIASNFSYLSYRLDTNSAFNLSFNPTPSYKYAASDDLLFEEVLTWNINETTEFIGGGSYQLFGDLPKTNDLSSPFNPSDYKSFDKTITVTDPFLGNFGFNPIVNSNFASFAQLTNISEKQTFIAGVRFDYHTRYGVSFNPRIASMFKLTPTTTFRTSYSEAFRAASAYYAYNAVAVPDVANNSAYYISVPNETLKPEKFYTYEFGVRQRIGKRVSLDFIIFQNRIRDLIVFQVSTIDTVRYSNTSQSTVESADNSGSTSLTGVVLNYSVKGIVEKINLSFDGSLTFNKGSENLPNGEVINNAKQTPKWFYKSIISAYLTENLFLSSNFTLSSGWYSAKISSVDDYNQSYNYIKGYYCVDMNLTYKLKKWDVYVRALNVTNSHFGGIEAYPSIVSLDFNPQYNRYFSGGVRVRL